MARPRAQEPYVQQKVSIPATLMARFNNLHFDPVHSKPQYGKISEVFTALLTDYVNRMERGDDPLSSEPKVESL